ncbi:MAG: GntR family transcriptional regulator, partial [Clostridiales bacterium]
HNHPMYLQLRSIIRRKIESGEYPLGSSLPPENDLAKKYGINKLTVRAAIKDLIKEGLLKSVQGKGVYVCSKIEYDLEVLGGFTQTMKEKNIVPKKKILTKEKILANKKYANIFNVDVGEELYYIRRLDYANGEPISLEEIYIPYYLVDRIEGIDLNVFSLYEIYSFYKINPIKAWETLEIAKLSQGNARLIGIDKDQAVYLFTYTSYDEKGRVIEFARNHTRSDKCSYKVHFHNDKI